MGSKPLGCTSKSSKLQVHRCHPPHRRNDLPAWRQKSHRNREISRILQDRSCATRPGKHTKNYGKSPVLMGKTGTSAVYSWENQLELSKW